ncbi:hypothetical protein [Nocardia xishanensis]|uniref:hypothetical protein n=1 Tax=Nocardia xishanensis TaxID=238964 RepID=UPI000A966E67|nr:hypothetical protein [Nocardia xishanensis]
MSIRVEAYETRVSEKWFSASGAAMKLGDLRAVVAACEGMPDEAKVEAGGLDATPDRERVWFKTLRIRSEQAA